MGINATVTGNLGATPEMITFDGGQALKLRVASNSSRKVNNERVKITDWVSVIYFGGGRAEALHKMALAPGSKVAITGSLTMREYQDKDGNTRHQLDMQAYDVELMGGPRSDESEAGAKPNGKPANSGGAGKPANNKNQPAQRR